MENSESRPAFKSGWDSVANRFNTHHGITDSGVAGNVFVAWPPLLELIEKDSCGKGNPYSILDYGCGTGGLCVALQQRGFSVKGFDASPEMIRVAKENSPDTIEYSCSPNFLKTQTAAFSAVTAIMVLQFIPDAAQTFSLIHRCLKADGLFLFAVHDCEFIRNEAARGTHYTGLDDPDNPTRANIAIEENLFAMFLRTPTEYQALGERIGFQQIFCERPEYSPQFIKEYYLDQGRASPVNKNKYLLMGFRKLS